jgi:hypothetical protein
MTNPPMLGQDAAAMRWPKGCLFDARTSSPLFYQGTQRV